MCFTRPSPRVDYISIPTFASRHARPCDLVCQGQRGDEDTIHRLLSSNSKRPAPSSCCASQTNQKSPTRCRRAGPHGNREIRIEPTLHRTDVSLICELLHKTFSSRVESRYCSKHCGPDDQLSVSRASLPVDDQVCIIRTNHSTDSEVVTSAQSRHRPPRFSCLVRHAGTRSVIMLLARNPASPPQA